MMSSIGSAQLSLTISTHQGVTVRRINSFAQSVAKAAKSKITDQNGPP
jgi:hypothetical protein